MKVFWDTSAFVALAYSKDAHHAEAVEKRDRLTAGRHPAYTSDAVLYETLNWLAVRMGPRSASEFGRSIWLESTALRIETLDAEDRLGALVILEKFAQIPLSFTDASIIHLYRKLGMDRLFTFDRQFVQANLPAL